LARGIQRDGRDQIGVKFLVHGCSTSLKYLVTEKDIIFISKCIKTWHKFLQKYFDDVGIDGVGNHNKSSCDNTGDEEQQQE
jgi:hypothetical protein